MARVPTGVLKGIQKCRDNHGYLSHMVYGQENNSRFYYTPRSSVTIARTRPNNLPEHRTKTVKQMIGGLQGPDSCKPEPQRPSDQSQKLMHKL